MYNPESGFANIDGVHVWIYGPGEHRTDWSWSATRYNGEYPGGCPRYVDGIGSIHGSAKTEDQALQLATAAARLIGKDPTMMVEASAKIIANAPVLSTSDNGRVKVKRVGSIDVPSESGSGHKNTTGYAVFIDGVEQEPWLPLAEALADASVAREKLGTIVADGPAERVEVG